MMCIARRRISASVVSSCRYTAAVSTSTTNTNIMGSTMLFSQRYMAGGPRNPEHTKRIKRKLQQKILSQNNAAAKKKKRKQQQNIPQQHLIANVDARRQILELVCDDNNDDDAVNNDNNDISKMKPKKYSIPSNIKPHIGTIENYITNTWIHQYGQQGVSTSKLRNDLAFRCKEIQGVELLYKKKLDGNVLQSIVWDIVSSKEKEEGSGAFIGKGNDGRYSGNSIGLRVNSKGQMILYPKMVDEDDDDDEKEEEDDDADNKMV